MFPTILQRSLQQVEVIGNFQNRALPKKTEMQSSHVMQFSKSQINLVFLRCLAAIRV